MEILVASSNPHKLDEIRAVFASRAAEDVNAPDVLRRIEFVGLDHVDPRSEIEEPVEDADTFEGNALIKARYYADATSMVCLADDSGLAVDALGGAPGVFSARFSGAGGPRSEVDMANNRLVLDRLEGVPVEERTAQFVCAMVIVEPSQTPVEGKHVDDRSDVLTAVRGTIDGRILLPEEADDPVSPHLGRGHNGFGYDPLFLVPTLGVTTAELTPEQKNAISHRGQATMQTWDELSRLPKRLRAFD